MRLILLLVAMLIVGLLVTRQIGPTASQGRHWGGESQPPAVPTRPQDLQQFSEGMDKFLQDSETERRRKIDQATQ